MNSQTVEITSAGIRKILNKYTPERAIAEYVWNGFDAKATVVNIDFEIDNAELDTIKNIRITDNGTGICYEELPIKFKKFYESQKIILNLQEEKTVMVVLLSINLRDLLIGKHAIVKMHK